MLLKINEGIGIRITIARYCQHFRNLHSDNSVICCHFIALYQEDSSLSVFDKQLWCLILTTGLRVGNGEQEASPVQDVTESCRTWPPSSRSHDQAHPGTSTARSVYKTDFLNRFWIGVGIFFFILRIWGTQISSVFCTFTISCCFWLRGPALHINPIMSLGLDSCVSESVSKD